MDPLGKHQSWTLLRRLRAGRTIQLTTHLMDEADTAADQVAIMAGGRVHCAGSPAFLKKRRLARATPLRSHASPPKSTQRGQGLVLMAHGNARAMMQQC